MFFFLVMLTLRLLLVQIQSSFLLCPLRGVAVSAEDIVLSPQLSNCVGCFTFKQYVLVSLDSNCSKLTTHKVP